MLEQIPELVNANAALVRRGARCNIDFVVGVGPRDYHITIRAGRVEEISAANTLMRSHAFAIRAEEEAWQRFWQPLPAPGYHDLFAMTKSGAARIEGDWLPLMTHLRYIKELLAAPRMLAAAAP